MGKEIGNNKSNPSMEVKLGKIGGNVGIQLGVVVADLGSVVVCFFSVLCCSVPACSFVVCLLCCGVSVFVCVCVQGACLCVCVFRVRVYPLHTHPPTTSRYTTHSQDSGQWWRRVSPWRYFDRPMVRASCSLSVTTFVRLATSVSDMFGVVSIFWRG